METNNLENMRYKAAQKRVKDIKAFYVHLTVYLVINTGIFLLITRETGLMEGLTNISNYSTLFFWGIGLFAHWASIFGFNMFFGKKWEEKKIREIMEKDKKKIWK